MSTQQVNNKDPSWLEPFLRNRSLNPQTSSAKEFLHEIQISVDLQSLYRVIDTTFDNDDLTHCAVLLEIINPDLRAAYNNSRYLLQVWYYRKQIHEVPLKKPPRLWYSSGNFFVYLPSMEDEGNEYVHIINEEKEENIVKVSNFAQGDDIKFLVYQPGPVSVEEEPESLSDYTKKGILACASNYEIQIMSLPEDTFDNATTMDSSEVKVRKIQTDSKIMKLILQEHGKFFILFETKDHQLDFNILEIVNINNDSSFNYRFKQYTEIPPRKENISDPIEKVDIKYNSNYSFTIAKRKSGYFDLYWDCQKKDSSTIRAFDIKASTSAFYFLIDQEGEGPSFQTLNHNGESNIDCSMITKMPEDGIDFSQVAIKDSQSSAFIFCGFISEKLETHSLFIAHNKFVSIYNLTDQKWEKHIAFEAANIHDIFRMKTEGSEENAIGVLLRNGDIYQLDRDNLYEHITQDQRKWAIEGEVVIGYADIANKEFYMALYSCEEDETDKYYLTYVKSDGSMTDLTPQLPALDENSNFLITQNSEFKEETYIVVQNQKRVRIYQLNKDGEAGPTLKELVDFGDIEHIGDDYSLHSAVFYGKDNILLLDEDNLLVCDTKTKKCINYENIYCKSFNSFEKPYAYALCDFDGEDGPPEGLRIYNMDDIVENKRVQAIQLNDCNVGCSANVIYDEDIERVVYMKSVTHVEIIPNVYQNNIKFFGIDGEKDFFCYKMFDDEMVTVNKKGLMQTWNIINGKLVRSHQIPDFPYQEYTEYYNNVEERAQKVLLMSNEPDEDKNMEDFYADWQIKVNNRNQVNYLDGDNRPKVHNWKYIEIVGDREIKEHLNFDWPCPTGNLQLYINCDMTRIIEITSFSKTYIYEILDTDKPKQRLHLIQRLYNYPDEMEITDNVLQCYSPDFSQTLWLDKRNNTFEIHDTYTDQLIVKIPKDIMSFKKMDEIKLVIRRFRWMDNKSFKVVNEEGVEEWVDYTTSNFRAISYNVVPEFEDTYKYMKSEGRDYCYFYSGMEMDPKNTLTWLKKKYQKYKTSYYLDNYNTNLDLYRELIHIDRRDITRTSFPFTFLDWRLIEQICDGSINIPDINEKQVKSMLYNILPGGGTILHRLCLNEQADDIIELFKIAQPNKQKVDEIKHHVPFLPNFKGKSPFHIALQKYDYKSVNFMLKYLAGYDLDHHSRAIKDLIPLFIEKELPELMPYLESRMQQNQQVQSIQKGCIQQDSTGIVASELWFERQWFDKMLLDKESKMESKIKCEFVDIPHIYHFNDDDFSNLFDQFAGTEWLDIFTLKPVQKIIEFNFGIVKEYTIKKLFIPYCFFMLFFIAYYNGINSMYQDIKNNEDPEQQTTKYLLYVTSNLFGILIALFATYFLQNEVRQFIQGPLDYLSSVWNYIDIIPALGIYTLLFMNFVPSTPIETIAIVKSITSFFMWLKLLYFMRVFKGTGYLISMIFQVISDMKIFLLILSVALIAFGDSFLSISQANTSDSQFTTGLLDSFIFTYLMILGAFDTTAFGSVALTVVWIFFLLCTLFNMIIMLNLLISIISETFANVNSNAAKAVYQSMASIVSENAYLVPHSKRKEYAEQNLFLLVVTNLESKDDDQTNPVMEQFDNVKQLLADVKTIVQEQANAEKKLYPDLDKILPRIKKIMAKLEIEDKEEAEEKAEKAEGEEEGEEGGEEGGEDE